MKNLSLLLFLFALSACQTAPKDYSKVEGGHWKAKVLVQDKKTQKKHIIKLDINAIRQEKLRIDTTMPSGYHLSSLVLIKESMRLLLMRDKKLYISDNSPNALKPLITIPLEPQILHNIIFDIPITQSDWSCVNDKRGWVSQCKNESSNISIVWSSRKAEKKTVKLEHPAASLQMHFYEFHGKLADRKNLFKIKKPKAFKAYRIK